MLPNHYSLCENKFWLIQIIIPWTLTQAHIKQPLGFLPNTWWSHPMLGKFLQLTWWENAETASKVHCIISLICWLCSSERRSKSEINVTEREGRGGEKPSQKFSVSDNSSTAVYGAEWIVRGNSCLLLPTEAASPELANPQSVRKSTTVRSCVNILTFRAHEKAFSPTLMDFGSSSSRFSQILTSPSLPQVTMQLWKETGFVKIQESASFFKHLVVMPNEAFCGYKRLLLDHLLRTVLQWLWNWERNKIMWTLTITSI